MKPPVLHNVKGQRLWLSPGKCIFWEDEKTLITSDLHFGKTGHFRKSGIPVPQSVYKKDLQRLVEQLQYFQPARLVAVGDFFHSHENKELDWFKRWRDNFSAIDMLLVKGNHDILADGWYHEAGIELHEKQWQHQCFSFIHDDNMIEENMSGDAYWFCGHIHPGVRLSGMGKQSLRFPSFHFGKSLAYIPAFSEFTGFVAIEPKAGESVFAVVEQSVIRIQ